MGTFFEIDGPEDKKIGFAGLDAFGDKMLSLVADDCHEGNISEIKEKLTGWDMAVIICDGRDSSDTAAILETCNSLCLLTVLFTEKKSGLKGADTIFSMDDVTDQKCSEYINRFKNILYTDATLSISFEDLESIFRDKGLGRIGAGSATGANMEVNAVKAALVDVKAASDCLLGLAGDISLQGISEAGQYIRDTLGDDVNLVIYSMVDDTLNDECRALVIAT